MKLLWTVALVIFVLFVVEAKKVRFYVVQLLVILKDSVIISFSKHQAFIFILISLELLEKISKFQILFEHSGWLAHVALFQKQVKPHDNRNCPQRGNFDIGRKGVPNTFDASAYDRSRFSPSELYCSFQTCSSFESDR